MCARPRSSCSSPGATESFRRSLPLSVLGRKDVATTCQRLGLHTVGSFADLDTARVAERFNKHALVLHCVARGELFELDGQRDLKLAARLRQLRGEEDTHDEQLGFFGQRGAGDDRAEAAAHRVRRRLGADAVVVASLRGGRVPEDRATLVPWGSPKSVIRDVAPWPGQMRAPSPATTLNRPVAVQLRDATTVRSSWARGDFSVRRPRHCCSRTSCVARSSGTRDRGRWSSAGGRSIDAAPTCRFCSCRARRCCSPPSRVVGGSRGSTTDGSTASSTPTRASASSTGRATPKSSPPRRRASASRDWRSPTTTVSTASCASPKRRGPSVCPRSSAPRSRSTPTTTASGSTTPRARTWSCSRVRPRDTARSRRCSARPTCDAERKGAPRFSLDEVAGLRARVARVERLSQGRHDARPHGEGPSRRRA
jgi:hypothetical protein